ncbi:MAG: hypothetical protein CM15mP14_1980 [Rhodospirillaceae bacterium]|nr:MAG: hypothetical protein CM15mP14_1980 [Rhodospirillaceae bacterium]
MPVFDIKGRCGFIRKIGRRNQSLQLTLCPSAGTVDGELTNLFSIFNAYLLKKPKSSLCPLRFSYGRSLPLRLPIEKAGSETSAPKYHSHLITTYIDICVVCFSIFSHRSNAVRFCAGSKSIIPAMLRFSPNPDSRHTNVCPYLHIEKTPSTDEDTFC